MNDKTLMGVAKVLKLNEKPKPKVDNEEQFKKEIEEIVDEMYRDELDVEIVVEKIVKSFKKWRGKNEM